MATITSWATLKTEIAAWLNRSDLTDVIPGLTQLGEARIYRDLRVRQMETALSSAIASGVVAVPSGYLGMKYAYLDGTPVQRLERKDAEWIYQNYPTRAAESKPFFFAREAGNFIFGPYPDSAYTMKGVYWKKLDPLSDSNTSNWLITDAPDLILFASLCEAAPYLGDDARLALWESKYAALGQAIQRQDSAEDVSGGPIAMVAR